jgi:hypothetical protein
MIKTLYILWFQGFENAPGIVKLCLQSWIYFNPDWEIIELDNSNLHNYITLKDDYKDISSKEIPFAAKSDMIRISILKHHGGLWVDSTTFCVQPLSDWLPNYIEQGFFGFAKPHKEALLSSWFLYGEKENYIVNTWFSHVQKYWLNHTAPHTYFWFHGTVFGNLYSSNQTFKNLWDSVSKFSAGHPHFLLYKFMGGINPQIREHVLTKKAPLYKLKHHIDHGHFSQLRTTRGKVIFFLNKLLNPLTPIAFPVNSIIKSDDPKLITQIDTLVEKIQTIKSNRDYRISDILNKAGHKWEDSKKQVLKNKLYSTTILYKYLTKVKSETPNLILLKKIIINVAKEKNYPIPSKNELVVHIRAGDVSSFINTHNVKTYLIKHPMINKITIVICFSYSDYAEKNLWLYTDKKHNINIINTKKILESMLTLFPLYTIDIVSNTDIDKDIVYCATSTHFMKSNRGFSKLMKGLHQIKINI